MNVTASRLPCRIRPSGMPVSRAITRDPPDNAVRECQSEFVNPMVLLLDSTLHARVVTAVRGQCSVGKSSVAAPIGAQTFFASNHRNFGWALVGRLMVYRIWVPPWSGATNLKLCLQLQPGIWYKYEPNRGCIGSYQCPSAHPSPESCSVLKNPAGYSCSRNGASRLGRHGFIHDTHLLRVRVIRDLTPPPRELAPDQLRARATCTVQKLV